MSPRTNLHVAEQLGVRLPASPPPEPSTTKNSSSSAPQKSPLKAGTQRPNGRSPKNDLKKSEKTTQNCVRKTVGNPELLITADRPHVDELQLRHQHCFLQCLNNNTVVAQQRARRHPPKNCTWRISGLLHCASWSLQHNRNVPHSGDELDLRHPQVELLGLQELVADVHTDVDNQRPAPASALPSIYLPPWAGGEQAASTPAMERPPTVPPAAAHEAPDEEEKREGLEILGTSISCAGTKRSTICSTSSNLSTICGTRASKICTMGPSSPNCSMVCLGTRSCGPRGSTRPVGRNPVTGTLSSSNVALSTSRAPLPWSWWLSSVPMGRRASGAPLWPGPYAA